MFTYHWHGCATTCHPWLIDLPRGNVPGQWAKEMLSGERIRARVLWFQTSQLFPLAVCIQEQISASQADKASISEYMWWLEWRFLVTTMGLYQIPISEHLRLEMTRRRIVLHSESRNLLFLFIGFLIFQSIFLCPSGLMFSQIPALSPGEGMTEFRELVFWMGLWLSIWNFYRRNGSNRGLTGEVALNVYMDTYMFVFFDTLEPM